MHRVYYLLWLKHMGLSSNSKFLEALDYFGSPEELFEADREAYEESSMFNVKELNYLCLKDTSWVEKEIELCNKNRVYLVDYYSKYYPPLLRKTPEPPLVLYVLGDKSCLTS
ncbi:MAG: hypothetical protein Q8882_03750, partial [Bacillota bacterium]|nr:hypothetical protein [Bacillota bacterium]